MSRNNGELINLILIGSLIYLFFLFAPTIGSQEEGVGSSFHMYCRYTGVTIYDTDPDTNLAHTISGCKFVSGSYLNNGERYYLFEDGGGTPYDCYIEVKQLGPLIEVWAGSCNTHSRFNELYYGATLLTQGTGPMPIYHGYHLELLQWFFQQTVPGVPNWALLMVAAVLLLRRGY